MNWLRSNIKKEIKLLRSDDETFNLDQQIAAFQRLKAASSTKDLPLILEFLRSDKGDFWVRELLAELICELGGPEYLPELLEALEKNYQEGHDNDGFHLHLTDLVQSHPQKSYEILTQLSESPNHFIKDSAEWLIGYCS